MVPPLLIAVFSSFLFISTPVNALGFQEAEAVKLYGGTYSTDCANPAAPRAILGETLKVEYGNKRMTGENIMATATYFDPQPPPNHVSVLLGEVRGSGGSRLIFVVNRDKNGLYIELMGEDAKVENALKAVLGMAQFKAKYRDCDAASRTWMNTPAPSAAQAAPASDSVQNWDYVGDRKFKQLYHKALGSKSKIPWIARLDGPSSGGKEVSVAGVTYWQIAVCKPHDCADNNLILIYDRNAKIVYGLINERGNQSLFGRPSTTMKAELERLWKSEWRQGN
jgi:hypothetical protein